MILSCKCQITICILTTHSLCTWKNPLYFSSITGERKILRDSKISLVVYNFITSTLKAAVLRMKPSTSRYWQWLQGMRSILLILFFTLLSLKYNLRFLQVDLQGISVFQCPEVRHWCTPFFAPPTPQNKKASGTGPLSLFNQSDDASVLFFCLWNELMVGSYS